MDFLPFDRWIWELEISDYSSPYTTNFLIMGYESSALFSCLADLICLTFLVGIALLFYAMITRISNKVAPEPDVTKFHTDNYSPPPPGPSYNNLILFCKLTFLPLFLFALINLVGDNYSSSGYSIFNIVLAFLFNILMATFLLFAVIFVLKNQLRFYEDVAIHQKFGALYANSKKGASHYSFICLFLGFRFIYIMILTFVYSYGNVQIPIMLFFSFVMLVYLIALRPFMSIWKVLLEIFNWVVITLCFGMALMLADIGNPYNYLHAVGYFFISIISIAILINLGFVFVEVFINIRLTYDAIRRKKLQIHDGIETQHDPRNYSMGPDHSHMPNNSYDPHKFHDDLAPYGPGPYGHGLQGPLQQVPHINVNDPNENPYGQTQDEIRS